MRIPIADLQTLVSDALRAAGASENMARVTAKCLVAADARGLATHGVARVPTYCGHLKSGRARGDAVPRVVHEHGGTVLVDAAEGLAYPACELAVNEAIARAREHGVAFAGITNSHHAGALGVLLEPVAHAGFVGFGFSNAAAAIVPAGGAHPVFGTNPIAAVFPRRNTPPLIVDLSLTQVTRGEIMLRHKRGEPIPEGWGRDAAGNPTTDAQKILVGGILDAAGGTKGTVLALAVELLCCALTGATLSHHVYSVHDPDKGGPPHVGQAFIAIDPAALAGNAIYFERVEALVAEMLKDDGVRLPGDRRHALAARAAKEGIEVPPDLEKQLRELARR